MDKPYRIINGNSLEVLDTLEENSIDAIITDPPYELGFMGKSWDKSGIAYNVELWKKALRVLKAGGYLLAFGGSRTYHRIACAIEDAGFEIRDTVMWLYGSGFPKSMNIGLAVDKKNGVESEVIGINKSVQDLKEVGKITGHKMTFGQEGTENCVRKDVPILKANNEWSGWGTCLKPAFEPIIMARKPFKGNLVDNVLENRCGGLNIDECRVPFEDTPNPATNPKYRKNAGYKLPEKGQTSNGAVSFTSSKNETNDLGRFPANVILTYDETDFDEVCDNMPETSSSDGEADYDDNSGNACRYFYCAKASKKDRDGGLYKFENASTGTGAPKKNIHPTVKPVELMQYLIRLVVAKGGVILDIFNGSGSTGKAAMFENRERDANYKYIGIELEKEYCDISEYRIDYALNKYQYDILDEIEENEKKGQLSLFDFSGEEHE